MEGLGLDGKLTLEFAQKENVGKSHADVSDINNSYRNFYHV